MSNESKKLKTFDARKLMEIAVEVMKESIPEDRGDTKVPPAVARKRSETQCFLEWRKLSRIVCAKRRRFHRQIPIAQ